jgi:hypothetical protein
VVVVVEGSADPLLLEGGIADEVVCPRVFLVTDLVEDRAGNMDNWIAGLDRAGSVLCLGAERTNVECVVPVVPPGRLVISKELDGMLDVGKVDDREVVVGLIEDKKDASVGEGLLAGLVEVVGNGEFVLDCPGCDGWRLWLELVVTNDGNVLLDEELVNVGEL